MRKREFSHHTHITHSPRCSYTHLRLDYLKQEGELANLSSLPGFSLPARLSKSVRLGPLWGEIHTILPNSTVYTGYKGVLLVPHFRDGIKFLRQVRPSVQVSSCNLRHKTFPSAITVNLVSRYNYFRWFMAIYLGWLVPYINRCRLVCFQSGVLGSVSVCHYSHILQF